VGQRTKVTFNGTDLTEAYVVSDLRTSLLPRTVATQQVAGRDGTAYMGASMAERSITLTLTARGRTPAERQAAARHLAAVLAVDEPAPLALGMDEGRYWLAVPNSTGNAKRYVNHTSFDVTFLATDPVMYGQERSVTVPSGGSLTFDVEGTYPAMPTITAPQARNGSGGFWRIAEEDGSFMLVRIPVSSAQPVVADCAARVLTVTGVVTLLEPASDWLVLEPGRHTLTMTGTGAATITYRERWL